MEKLYNNIVLPDSFADNPSDAQNVPYLLNPPEVIDVTVGRQLFVDDFLIEETDLESEYHKAEKFEGNPVLKAEMPWEIEQSPVACPKSGGVWYDEEEKIFKNCQLYMNLNSLIELLTRVELVTSSLPRMRSTS